MYITKSLILMDHQNIHYIIVVILVVACALFVLNTVTIGQFIVIVALLMALLYLFGLHLTR
jgi:hypothetical protein